jgi:hypothetical protein
LRFFDLTILFDLKQTLNSNNLVLDVDGAGGKGTWGKLLDTEVDSHIDRNDPNYDSGEVKYFLFLWFCLTVSSNEYYVTLSV